MRCLLHFFVTFYCLAIPFCECPCKNYSINYGIDPLGYTAAQKRRTVMQKMYKSRKIYFSECWPHKFEGPCLAEQYENSSPVNLKLLTLFPSYHSYRIVLLLGYWVSTYPGKSWDLRKGFSRPGKSWNSTNRSSNFLREG